MLGDVWNDIRYALRLQRRSPGFALTTILTLALGIGANTAIFSLLDGVLLKGLPVREPDRLVSLAAINDNTPDTPRPSFPYALIDEMRGSNTAFSHLFTFRTMQLTLSGDRETERVNGALVSGDYFSGLGVDAEIGRVLQSDDNRPRDAAPVVVASYGLWQRRFAGSPQIVGQTIRVNGNPFTVVGVARRGFVGAQLGAAQDLWIPIWERRGSFASGAQLLLIRGITFLPAIGRLKPGVTVEQAETAITNVWRALPPPPLGSPSAGLARERIELLPATRALSNLQRTFAQPLWVLMALVGLVLLIACGNVAALLIVRAMARRGETATRAALGASRARLVRSLLVESLLLSGAGTALGAAGAYWGVGFVLALVPADRFVLDVQPNPTVLAFSAGVAAIVAILLGILPAAPALRFDLRSVLGSESLGVTSGARRFGLRQALVLVQVTFSVILLVGATLFVRTLIALQRTDSGVRAEQVLQLTLDPGSVGYAPRDTAAVYERVRERVAALPNVRNTAFMLIPMLGGNLARDAYFPPGFVPRSGGVDMPVFDIVSQGFFETVGIPLVRGRTFTDRDDADAPKVIVINERMARKFFGNDNPLGKILRSGATGPELEIVGVVGETKFSTVREESPTVVFLPFGQWNPAVAGGIARTLYVRTDGDPLALVEPIRAAARDIDRNIPIYGVKTVAAQIDETLVQERLTATLSGWFGTLALFLAALGLYGLIHYSVQRRQREFGLRLALGAAPALIARLVLREMLGLLALGIVFGLVLAVPLARFVTRLLYNVTPTDASVLLLSAAAMAAVGVAAAAWPAWRASRVSPLKALRVN